MAQAAADEPKEEPQKSYHEILLGELSAGLTEFRRPTSGLLLSSLSGGLDVSFSLLLMTTVWTKLQGVFPDEIVELVVANLYSIGFIFVVVGRSELFTEHTSRALFPVLDGQVGWLELARLWSLVLVGNIAGTAAFAAAVAYVGPPLGVMDRASFAALSQPLIERTWWLTIAAGVLAGWLMGLLSWLVSACRETISQIVIVWLVTTAIGITRSPHAIVGAGEVLLGLYSRQGVTFGDFVAFLALTTLGNGIGGAVFVAALKHSHSTRHAE
jgi:formate/nitrite transporter FocA (FNT family)